MARTRHGLAAFSWFVLLNLCYASTQDTSGERVHMGLAPESGTEYIWQMHKGGGKPRALLFLFHGCQHSATDWFMPSTDCPRCIGLPEERAIVKVARETAAYRYAVVAVSSQDREYSKCWRMNDVEPVLEVLNIMHSMPVFRSLPVFALGASSGGSFVGGFAPKANNFVAGCVMIMSLHDSQLQGRAYPALEFVVMARDGRSKQGAKRNVETLVTNHGGSAKPHASLRVLHPLPITPSIFHDRSLGDISDDLSQRIYDALSSNGFIDDKGYLVEDPRRSSWRQTLAQRISEVQSGAISLEADASAVSEIMNVAWSMHEISATDVSLTFDFFESHHPQNGP